MAHNLKDTTEKLYINYKSDTDHCLTVYGPQFLFHSLSTRTSKERPSLLLAGCYFRCFSLWNESNESDTFAKYVFFLWTLFLLCIASKCDFNLYAGRDSYSVKSQCKKLTYASSCLFSPTVIYFGYLSM